MNYPFWDVGLGYGWLMGGIAIIHVFVSHFAIGGGLYLVVAERGARIKNDLMKLEYLRGLSKFFVLTTLVFGAVTGVGIWFTIGLLNPTATELLIHNFVWMWATEWCLFIIEILSAIIYFYGWKTMSPRAHMTVGWIYFGAAWLSLAIINGMLSFMLTPGDWLQTGNMWDGFFNPTYFSSLVFRTGVCIMLAGLYSLMVASRLKPSESKGRFIAYNAAWALVGMVVIVPTLFWYWTSIPEAVRTTAVEMMSTPMRSLWFVYVFGIALALMVVLVGLILRKRAHLALTIVMMAVGLLWFGSFEWFRESVRKPWVVSGYMYGNALEMVHVESYQSDGLLTHIAFRTGDDGADLFRHACRSCHTIDGYHPLKPAFDGTDEAFVAGIVKGTGAIRGNMPPWLGTDEEAKLIAAHVYERLDHRHLAEIYGLTGAALGEKVYQIRCGKCHVFGGYNDKSGSLLGQSEQDYQDLLDAAGELATEMPAFTGDQQERQALIEFLTQKSQQKQGGL